MLQQYVRLASDKKLVIEHHYDGKYYTTSKGKKFLSGFILLKEILEMNNSSDVSANVP